MYLLVYLVLKGKIQHVSAVLVLSGLGLKRLAHKKWQYDIQNHKLQSHCATSANQRAWNFFINIMNFLIKKSLMLIKAAFI